MPRTWYFDKADADLLAMIGRMWAYCGQNPTTPFFDASLHPHGIKDMVLSQELRIAWAAINLLRSLDAGKAQDRLRALQALHEEALSSAQSTLRRNTARVLLQIMKDLVRQHGDRQRSLMLAHDFRRAAAGTPRVVRQMLARYHLAEMPEDWSQMAFDDHVYDANTVGRKTPTHLIMDAWIKGLRSLTVLYRGGVQRSAAEEILKAAAITGITVRIGLEFSVPFYGHNVRMVWAPRGFSDTAAFLDFLEQPGMRSLIDPEVAQRLSQMPLSGVLRYLADVHGSCRTILSVADLTAEDLVELLWECEGAISHVEIFNLSDWHEGRLTHLAAINELQTTLNRGRGMPLKQLVWRMLERMRRDPAQAERAEVFARILHDVPRLWEYYRDRPLKSRIGSGSTGRADVHFGMGFAYPETLPQRAQAQLRREERRLPVPIRTTVEERITYVPHVDTPRWLKGVYGFLRRMGLRHAGMGKKRQWAAFSDTAHMAPTGNMVSLGGVTRQLDETEHAQPAAKAAPAGKAARPGLAYCSQGVSNALKVLAGFIPSVFSFWYTQEWWFLAWFGTFIWFGITGVRNVIQMVVAGRGVSRTTLLRWKDHVRVSRLCDSLMYTGISVLLLEAMVRVWLLEDCFGINVKDDPLIVFTVLNIINGFYICAHNIFRGFPREAAVGNIFRSALSIPVSSLYNIAFVQGLALAGVADPMFYVLPSAAIISKLASDTVAAWIEGHADSRNNMRMRRRDFHYVLRRIFACAARLEMSTPETRVLRYLSRPEGLSPDASPQALEWERELIIAALDMMYMWFYQQRAQDALMAIIRGLSPDDRRTLVLAHGVLVREAHISRLFVDGLVGTSFARPLAFYLARRKTYLRAIVRACRHHKGARPQ